MEKTAPIEKQSCGAIFYTFDPNGQIGIILGNESRTDQEAWLPFKGLVQPGETYEQTAKREVLEETCGLVNIESINLNHHFSTKYKDYHIGLCEVPFDIIEQFAQKKKTETREEFLEKKELRFFPLKTVLGAPNVHSISRASIIFYQDLLYNISFLRTGINSTARMRYQGLSHERAEKYISDMDLGDTDGSDSSDEFVPVRSIRSKRVKKTKPSVLKSDKSKVWRRAE